MFRSSASTLLHTALFVAVAASPATAQTDDARFNVRQAERLNKFAKDAFKKGFPRQARLIWLQSIKLYDTENAEARKAIGQVKVGSSWGPDPSFKYPTEDTGTSRDGAALFKAYEKLKKDLAAGHRRQAQSWNKAGRKDKADHHYKLLLRWVKTDKDAQAALEHQELADGLTGTNLERTLFDNSKKVEAEVARQAGTEYGVDKIEVKAPVLDRAQVEYVTVKSEHFTLHGDPEELENLKQALVWGERALRVAQVAFPWKAQLKSEWAFFTGKDTYKQILKANGDGIPNLEWRLENTSTSGVGNMIVGATGSVQVLYDAVVRNVAKRYAGFGSDGLSEGIGHTFVGMVFNNNRLFAVDLEKQQGTVASEEDREYTSPDFDVWKTLALKMAWKMTGGVAALDLPYCEAASFTNEQRIKAWSFCDYVMRRDPELLRKMDRMAMQAKGKRKQPTQFAEAYEKAAGVSLAQLDKEWEDFWTEATPALQAIRSNTPPLAAVSKGVEKWLTAFNAARKANNAASVTWSTNLSTRCFDHAKYLKANKKELGPVAEHTQKVELGGSHLGSMFAQMAIVERGANPGKAKKIFEKWMGIPGYRDALVHDFLRSVGIYSEGDLLVMNVVTGLGAPKSRSAGYLVYPRGSNVTVPRAVKVSDIGPELEALLETNGKGGRKTVGYPLTIHFGQQLLGDRNSYQCVVQDSRGNPVSGAILLDGGSIRRSSAPGMATFYPFDPLPSGKISARWVWEVDGQQRDYSSTFQVK